MKKITILSIISSILFASCNSSNDHLSIICPLGAPTIAFYSEYDNSYFQTNSSVPSVLSMMNNYNGYDVVVVDTISGLQAINNGAEYKIASTITFGNFYLINTSNDVNQILDKDDYVLIFNKGGTPDKIFNYLYNDFSNVHYCSSVNDASIALQSGVDYTNDNNKVDYVMISEPVLSSIKLADYEKNIINIQDKISEKGMSIYQASIFVKNSSNSDKIREILQIVESNINNCLNEKEKVNEFLNNINDKESFKNKYGFTTDKVKSIISSNNINLGYKKAIDEKENIDNYLNMIGVGNSNEEVYFK